MKSVQDIYTVINSQLPAGWNWCTSYYMFGENRSQNSSNYGLSSDREDLNNVRLNTEEIEPLVVTMLREIAPSPLQLPTHVELTIESNGNFNTVVGYGEPNWDPAPYAWPDDITAENYTYTKAWPNGLTENTKKRLKDPRSLIGYD